MHRLLPRHPSLPPVGKNVKRFVCLLFWASEAGRNVSLCCHSAALMYACDWARWLKRSVVSNREETVDCEEAVALFIMLDKV